MKGPAQVTADIQRRLASTWHLDASRELASWPHTVPLGHVSGTELGAGFPDFQRRAAEIRGWAQKNGLTVSVEARRVLGTPQQIPTHVIVPDIGTAVMVAGREWRDRYRRGQARAETLEHLHPGLENLSAVVRSVDKYTDQDFGLLNMAAAWFREHEAHGLTPRQVPIPGLHAKWLNSHGPELRQLSGKADLGLLPQHPSRLHFTYLDPAYLATSGRRHDSVSRGDTMTPAYTPSTVVIAENKDTAIHFPPVTGGIAVEGAGFSAAETAGTLPWLTGCPAIFYWGDMDAAGFEILHQFRKAGVRAESVLMDTASYEAYRHFGSFTDVKGRELTAPEHKNLPMLTATEEALYAMLTNPGWPGPFRIEQERIPLQVGLQAISLAGAGG